MRSKSSFLIHRQNLNTVKRTKKKIKSEFLKQKKIQFWLYVYNVLDVVIR